MNLDVQLVDLPEVSKEGQMFVLTRIRLNLRGEDGDLDAELIDPPGVPKEANFADTMFVLMRYALQMVEDNLERWDKDFDNLVLRKMSMTHELKCNKKSSCYNLRTR